MKFNGRSFATFGARRKLTWGVTQRARSARPIAASPFFRPMPPPVAPQETPKRLAA